MTNSTGLTLFYVQDPLCGWCYGFSPVVHRLAREFAGRLTFEAMAGGMVLGSRVQPIGQALSSVADSLPFIEAQTGASFGRAFHQLVAEGTYLYNSEPPCIALTAYKQLGFHGEATLRFSYALQTALFRDGRNLNKPEILTSIALEHGADPYRFAEKLKDPTVRGATFLEFTRAQEMRATSFPSLVLQQGKESQLIARGYTPYEELKPLLEQICEKAQAQ